MWQAKCLVGKNKQINNRKSVDRESCTQCVLNQVGADSSLSNYGRVRSSVCCQMFHACDASVY